ncbi:hypothetical protein OJAV_G00236300 [Oryzias javanicus]|uniref:Cyclin N-terminal domain-containing protein n=1 Tax=Oryzias javanicus TaxID=123683 RepID=A0A437BYJ3_ORYJA|nr:hypothetical protein OJAV_G00236300 [Oryzias javanicus]
METPELNIEYNPSDHPKASTIFLSKSQNEEGPHRNVQDKRKSLFINNHGAVRRKYSSCSTIFLDENTVSRPSLKYTIRCVALAIYYHIKNRDTNVGMLLEIFDEKLHPLSKSEVPLDYNQHDPDQKQIYRFVRTLFSAAQLTAECAIVTLVYLERLLTYAEIDICPGNWKRIVLGAILLASKVWDDQAVWNVDYCQILKDMEVEMQVLPGIKPLDDRKKKYWEKDQKFIVGGGGGASQATVAPSPAAKLHLCLPASVTVVLLSSVIPFM